MEKAYLRALAVTAKKCCVNARSIGCVHSGSGSARQRNLLVPIGRLSTLGLNAMPMKAMPEFSMAAAYFPVEVAVY